MNQIKENDLINLIKEKFPKFLPFWDSYTKKVGPNRLIGDDITPFLDYAIDEIKSENFREIEKIFKFIELLMCEGDEVVQTVIEACFLQSLYYKNPHEIQFIKFSKYLEKESIAYLRKVDMSNGTHIEGL